MLGKMTTSKSDTYRLNSFKKVVRCVWKRLTFRHQPAHPKTKKQNANPYKKTPSRLSTKKKKKKTKKQNLKAKPYFPIKI